MSESIPQYYFAHDYENFYDYLFSQPHSVKHFKPGDYLWAPDEPLEKVYFFMSGIAQTYVEHENGYRKILSFHGTGTVFPGFQKQSFKIERSIIIVAITEVKVLEFSRSDYYQMVLNNAQLSVHVIERTSALINLLIYEAAHQRYNDTFLKLCNLLYLLSQCVPEDENHKVSLTQENIANILAVNRVRVTQNLTRLRKEKIIISHRKCIEIIDLPKLISYCSLETVRS